MGELAVAAKHHLTETGGNDVTDRTDDVNDRRSSESDTTHYTQRCAEESFLKLVVLTAAGLLSHDPYPAGPPSLSAALRRRHGQSNVCSMASLRSSAAAT